MNKQFDGEVKTIKLSSVALKPLKNGSEMTTITDEDGKKYSFFNTKLDGAPTAAAESFKACKVGDNIEIGFVSEEKTFTDQSGKNVNYQQRTIRFIKSLEADMNPNGTYKPGKHPGLKDDDAVPF